MVTSRVHLRRFAALVFVGWVVCASQRAMAQTGFELMGKPMPKGQHIQTDGSAAFFNDGHTDAADKFQLTTYDIKGRARLFPDQRAEPRVGFDATYFNINTNDPALPSKLVDTSIAFGMGLLENDGWQGAASIGIGYAGAGAYDDGNGYYGKADFVIGKEFGKDNTLGFVIDYDGNRTFLPDVPLPGFQYTKRIEERLLLSVGFPFSSIEWTPTQELTIKAQYNFPDDGEINVDYAIVKQLGLFASYNLRQEAFHYDALPNVHDRLLFQQRRVEGGVRWTPWGEVSPDAGASLVVAGGYAFSQEFNVGWDSREPDRAAKPNDEPYVRIGFEFRY